MELTKGRKYPPMALIIEGINQIEVTIRADFAPTTALWCQIRYSVHFQVVYCVAGIIFVPSPKNNERGTINDVVTALAHCWISVKYQKVRNYVKDHSMVNVSFPLENL